MVNKAFYAPSPPPLSESAHVFRQWALREFERIAFVLQEGSLQGLQLDVLEALPEKPVEGMIGWFRATVAGASAGAYEYRGGAWIKL